MMYTLYRITHSPVADVFVIWAKLVDAEQGAAAKAPKASKAQGKASSGPPSSSIRGFLVERGARGLSTPVIEGKLSLRTSVTGQVVLEDVRVPAENLLPGAKGLSVRARFQYFQILYILHGTWIPIPGFPLPVCQMFLADAFLDL